MTRWLVGGLVGLSVAAGAFCLLRRNPSDTAAVVGETTPAVVSAPAAPAPPVVLPQVVEMTDLAPLLDPPARLPSGTPFEEVPVTAPVATPSTPERIPPAVEDDEDELTVRP